jgi:hypothetical protein
MKLYDEHWARGIVSLTLLRNPRVSSMVLYFIERMGEYECENPEEFVYSRLVFHLRRASFDKTWDQLKKIAETQINWPSSFTEFIAPATRVVKAEIMDHLTDV